MAERQALIELTKVDPLQNLIDACKALQETGGELTLGTLRVVVKRGDEFPVSMYIYFDGKQVSIVRDEKNADLVEIMLEKIEGFAE